MRARIVVSVVLAAGVLVGTSGCNLLAPQSTTASYDASDGVSGNVGDLAIRNAILLTADGTTGSLLVTVVNTGDSAHSLNIQFTGDTGKVTQKVTVKADATTTFGTPDTPLIALDAITAQPGSLFPVFFQYGNETGVELLVPVLDGSLDPYSTLIPTATPSPTDVPAPTDAPAPTATTAQ